VRTGPVDTKQFMRFSYLLTAAVVTGCSSIHVASPPPDWPAKTGYGTCEQLAGHYSDHPVVAPSNPDPSYQGALSAQLGVWTGTSIPSKERSVHISFLSDKALTVIVSHGTKVLVEKQLQLGVQYSCEMGAVVLSSKFRGSSEGMSQDTKNTTSLLRAADASLLVQHVRSSNTSEMLIPGRNFAESWYWYRKINK
jgi:hypothetical protein